MSESPSRPTPKSKHPRAHAPHAHALRLRPATAWRLRPVRAWRLRPAHAWRLQPSGVALAVAAAIALALAVLRVPTLVAWLLGVNGVVFALYGYDKSAARSQRRRVPESTLHLLALLGGSPAALAAQRVFRHKTAKRSFQVAFWLIACVQAALLSWIAMSR